MYTLNGSNVCVIHNVHKTKTYKIDISTLTDVQLKSLEIYVGYGVASLDGNTLTIDPLTSVILK